jgi:hypothetical protein
MARSPVAVNAPPCATEVNQPAGAAPTVVDPRVWVVAAGGDGSGGFLAFEVPICLAAANQHVAEVSPW